MKSVDFITLRSKNIIKRIELEKIEIITGDKYCSNISIGEKSFNCSKILKEIEQILPSNYFVRINKNEIVNINKIEEINITKRRLLLHNGSILYISVRRIKDVILLLETVS